MLFVPCCQAHESWSSHHPVMKLFVRADYCIVIASTPINTAFLLLPFTCLDLAVPTRPISNTAETSFQCLCWLFTYVYAVRLRPSCLSFVSAAWFYSSKTAKRSQYARSHRCQQASSERQDYRKRCELHNGKSLRQLLLLELMVVKQLQAFEWDSEGGGKHWKFFAGEIEKLTSMGEFGQYARCSD